MSHRQTSRDRRLEFWCGDAANLRFEIARQNATVAELGRNSRVQDEVISDLRQRPRDLP